MDRWCSASGVQWIGSNAPKNGKKTRQKKKSTSHATRDDTTIVRPIIVPQASPRPVLFSLLIQAFCASSNIYKRETGKSSEEGHIVMLPKEM